MSIRYQTIKTLLTLATVVCGPASSTATDASLGGFIPYVGISLTDKFKDSNTDLTFTYFLADPEFSLDGSQLSGGGSPYYDIALLDTGAATHILTAEASGLNGFNIDGNGFDGTNIQRVGGATGVLDLAINDPLAIFAAGLGDRTADGATLTMDTGLLRGQSSFATLSADSDWELPNILGQPMAAQHAVHIKNSDPQIFEFQGRTVRTPQVDFIDLGTGNQQGILRRTDLIFRPGASFINGPLYVQNLDIFSGEPFHENPQSPTIIESGGLFVDVDLQNGTDELQDKEFLFDTGADLTVISQLTAVRLGFDPVLDTPDFVLELEGSAGVAGGVPGFYADQLNIDTVGGSFTFENVPLVVFDVTNPSDPGNIIDGILGMHLFNGRDIVIDANPSIGQGGAGPSLYISDPVTDSHTWVDTSSSGSWGADPAWSGSGTPNVMWVAEARNVSGSDQTAVVSADSTVFQMVVSGTPTAGMTVEVQSTVTLTTFGEVKIETGGAVRLADGTLNAQFINIDGGTLGGSGDVFVGTGPINSTVRNLSGRVEPGDPLGILAIEGDLSNLDEGTIAFDLGGTDVESQYDQIGVDRFAFLNGILEVTLFGGFTPSIGNTFILITAGEGVVGQFDQLFLPAGFQWDVSYLSNSVVLELTGIGTQPGDFDFDGDVDDQDLAMWQLGYGTPGGYTGADFLIWQENLGAGVDPVQGASVPEPTTAMLLLIGISCLLRKKGGKPVVAQ